MESTVIQPWVRRSVHTTMLQGPDCFSLIVTNLCLMLHDSHNNNIWKLHLWHLKLLEKKQYCKKICFVWFPLFLYFLTRSWEIRGHRCCCHIHPSWLYDWRHVFKDRRKVRADLWELVVRLQLQDCTLQQIHDIYDVQHASNVPAINLYGEEMEDHLCSVRIIPKLNSADVNLRSLETNI